MHQGQGQGQRLMHQEAANVNLLFVGRPADGAEPKRMTKATDFEEFQVACGKQWSQIERSRRDADRVIERLGAVLKDYQNFDVECVFFGSLARREWTNGSDVDWTLLIDGQVDADHYKTAQAVATAIGAVNFYDQPLNEPGASGLFGNLTKWLFVSGILAMFF